MTSTGRIYLKAQQAFIGWCQGQSISDPPSHYDIARYLQHCVDSRGASTAPVHLSAIGDLFRSRGHNLDTSSPAIQRVIKAARSRMRTEKASKEKSRMRAAYLSR
jgi:hypothetical protein